VTGHWKNYRIDSEAGECRKFRKKISAAEASAIKEALAKRIKDDKPFPGIESLLRQHIEGLRVGKPISR